MENINILGVNISAFNKKQTLTKIKEFLTGQKQHYIVTPNPEIILTAKHDEEFFYILNKADLSLADGIGLKIAALLMGKNLPRITGADLVKDILELAEKQGRRVAVFNWKDGLSSAQDITIVLIKKYPKLKLIVQDVPEAKLRGAPRSLASGTIKEFQPEIIFCTFGAPYQEKFIFHNLKNLPTVKFGIGVGGAFDFLTNKIKRAPKLFRMVGIEWLWRLIKQPSRWKRIYNAVIVFSIKFFLWRFILPFFYRPNVVCLLYKKENHLTPTYQGGRKIKYKILIVERANEKNHWQLPQGGTDSQSLKKAGIRELNEEINNNKFKPVAIFPKLNVYEFDNEISKFCVLSKDVCGYKGQKQGLFIAEFLGKDEDIKINFWEHSAWRWVNSEDLIEQVHPIRRSGARIFLEKFKKFKM